MFFILSSLVTTNKNHPENHSPTIPDVSGMKLLAGTSGAINNTSNLSAKWFTQIHIWRNSAWKFSFFPKHPHTIFVDVQLAIVTGGPFNWKNSMCLEREKIWLDGGVCSFFSLKKRAWKLQERPWRSNLTGIGAARPAKRHWQRYCGLRERSWARTGKPVVKLHLCIFWQRARGG